ncbi:MAG: hypothetical protein WDA53_05665 [Bacillota bacterium]
MTLNLKIGDENSESAGLLISILMRYPEIGAISFNPDDHTMTLSFSCKKIITEKEFINKKNQLELCLDTYAYLEGKKSSVFAIQCLSTEEISVLKIKHKVESASKNEIALIINFLQQEFGDCLVRDLDRNELLEEEDLLLQDEFIGHMLESFKGKIPVNKIIAFREEGKVHLFKK